MHQLEKAASVVREGGVIAYATESVFGLGCNPSDESAVRRVIEIKRRPVSKGLIMIAGSREELSPFINEKALSPLCLSLMDKHWPGPFSIVVPASPSLSRLVTGNRDTVAVRVTKHEGVRRICALLGYPLISTSANFSGEEPLRTYEDTVRVLGDLVDYVVPGETMRLRSPSTVIDGMTGKILRN